MKKEEVIDHINKLKKKSVKDQQYEKSAMLRNLELMVLEIPELSEHSMAKSISYMATYIFESSRDNTDK